MSALKGCVVRGPVGCPITACDLNIKRCERDYRHVNLILTKTGNVPTSCAIIDFPVALVQAGCGRSFKHRCHQIGHTMCITTEMERKWTLGMQVMQPGTSPKCAGPGTMASNLSVLFVLLLAETSPTGSSTGSCSTNWNHWCCWSEHLLLKLHSESLDSGLSVWKEASLLPKKKKKRKKNFAVWRNRWIWGGFSSLPLCTSPSWLYMNN